MKNVYYFQNVPQINNWSNIPVVGVCFQEILKFYAQTKQSNIQYWLIIWKKKFDNWLQFLLRKKTNCM